MAVSMAMAMTVAMAMELANNKRGLGFFLFLLAAFSFAQVASRPASAPFKSTICSDIECPPYEVVYEAQEFSIRLYNYSVWMSTDAIQDESFVSATKTGFLKLFNYIQGANEDSVEVNMTAPVLTGVIPSDGPFCESSFKVRFYVPEAYQEDPPTASSDLDLHADRWGARYFAVKQFSGFALDSNVVVEAASLEVSLLEAGYLVESTFEGEEEYIIAQYNSPFDISGRINEVWLPLSDATVHSNI